MAAITPIRMTVPAIIQDWPEPELTIEVADLWTGKGAEATHYTIDLDGTGTYWNGTFPFRERYSVGEGWWTIQSGRGWTGFKHNMTGVNWREAIFTR